MWLTLETAWETQILGGKPLGLIAIWLFSPYEYGVHPGRSKGGLIQPDITFGDKVPSSPLKVKNVTSNFTAVETEAQRDKIASAWPSEM